MTVAEVREVGRAVAGEAVRVDSVPFAIVRARVHVRVEVVAVAAAERPRVPVSIHVGEAAVAPDQRGPRHARLLHERAHAVAVPVGQTARHPRRGAHQRRRAGGHPRRPTRARAKQPAREERGAEVEDHRGGGPRERAHAVGGDDGGVADQHEADDDRGRDEGERQQEAR